PEAKFHTAVRWLHEQARARKLREEEIRRYVWWTLSAAVVGQRSGPASAGLSDACAGGFRYALPSTSDRKSRWMVPSVIGGNGNGLQDDRWGPAFLCGSCSSLSQ